jgi:FkbM family methyltransferase
MHTQAPAPNAADAWLDDCRVGAPIAGALPLPPAASQTLDGAVAACRALCLQCARCVYVSASAAERECNWFRHCGVDDLKQPTAADRKRLAARNPALGPTDPLWATMRVRTPPWPDETVRERDTGVRLRTHSIQRWPGGGPEHRVWLVDDWAHAWIFGENNGERLVLRAVHRAASGCPPNGDGALMLDIGANTGSYSILAAALGCRAIAFEPQPGCRKRLKAAAAAAQQHAGVRRRVHVVPHPVGRVAGQPLRAPERGCRSAAPSVAPPPQNARSDGQHTVTAVAAAAAVEQALRRAWPAAPGAPRAAPRIAIVKIDTEGAEVSVLESLRPLWPRIDNLVIETTKYLWPRISNATLRDGHRVFADLFAPPNEFTAALVSDGTQLRNASAFRAYIRALGTGYFDQRDVWVTRTPRLFEGARGAAGPVAGNGEEFQTQGR